MVRPAIRSGVVRVLLVEDNPGDARLVELMLDEAGPTASFEVVHVGRLGEALECIEEEEFGVVLLDLSLPDAAGLETVTAVQGAAPYLPVVVLSGMADEEVALQAIGGGAEDYLIKGQSDGQLIARSIRYAIERKKAEERLAYLSQYDSLTGLANRALFQDRVSQALARAERDGQGNLVAVITLDLDRFKNFNDALGHGFGDMLLKSAAGRIRRCVREGDTVARLGSDEFGVVLEGISDAQEVAHLAQEISESVSEPFSLHGEEMFLTVSMGIAVRPPSEADALVRDSTAALQRAKDLGRDNYQFFAPEMNVQTFERLAMESRLRRALEREEFRLYYQPQVDLTTGRVVGAEALIRWKHPEYGLIPPGKFVPVLEDTRLILPVGEWILRTACEQLRAWQREGLFLSRVAVNISAQQFRQQDLPEIISSVLGDAGLTSSRLEIEITESLLMEDTEESNAKLGRLKSDRSLRIAIDDFGTGYSSLAYLKRFPIDVLKIDRSFVRDMAEDPDDASIVSAIIGLAHNLRLGVIAEGVEDEAQAEFLREQGCDEAQGYYFGRPMSAAEFARFMTEAEMRLTGSDG